MKSPNRRTQQVPKRLYPKRPGVVFTFGSQHFLQVREFKPHRLTVRRPLHIGEEEGICTLIDVVVVTCVRSEIPCSSISLWSKSLIESTQISLRVYRFATRPIKVGGEGLEPPSAFVF